MAKSKLTDKDSNDFEFLVLAGSETPVPFGERVIRGGRAGVDGHDYTLAGQQADAFNVRTMADFATEADGWTRVESYYALKGEIVTYTDEHLRPHTAVVVLGVQCSLKYRPFGTGFLEPAGQSNYVVEASFTMELTE